MEEPLGLRPRHIDMNSHPQPPLPFSARAVFIDFGSTLVFDRQKKESGMDFETLLTTLANILAEQKGISKDEAQRRVLELSENLPRTFESYADKLGIDMDDGKAKAARAAYIEWLSSLYHADAEVVSCLEQFRKKGIKLRLSTTHSSILCALKLEAAGLGHQGFFEDLCGGREVHPMGKLTRSFYTNLLEKDGVSPDEVVHVGKSLIWDRDLPMNAGIRQIILLDRNLSERYLQGENGEIYARSWSVIRHLVVPLTK